MSETYYIYDWSSITEKWELTAVEVLGADIYDVKLNRAWGGRKRIPHREFRKHFAKTPAEARSLARKHCEKMHAAMLSHAQTWETLLQKMDEDTSWRDDTSCRRSDGACLSDWCTTHRKWCFKKEEVAQ